MPIALALELALQLLRILTPLVSQRGTSGTDPLDVTALPLAQRDAVLALAAHIQATPGETP